MDRLEPGDSPAGEAEKISAAAVLDRVREVLRRKRAAGSLVAFPQALQPLDDDEFESLDSFPWRRSGHAVLPVDIQDLLSKYDEAFVVGCHRRMLLRDPQPQEMRQWLDRLAGGWPRTMIVVSLRCSRDGRRVGIGVEGLWSRAALAFPLMLYRGLLMIAYRRYRRS